MSRGMPVIVVAPVVGVDRHHRDAVEPHRVAALAAVGAEQQDVVVAVARRHGRTARTEDRAERVAGRAGDLRGVHGAAARDDQERDGERRAMPKRAPVPGLDEPDQAQRVDRQDDPEHRVGEEQPLDRAAAGRHAAGEPVRQPCTGHEAEHGCRPEQRAEHAEDEQHPHRERRAEADACRAGDCRRPPAPIRGAGSSAGRATSRGGSSPRARTVSG